MNFFKSFAVVACAALMLTACSEEQTTFNANSVTGRSVIKGTVVYNTGTTLENGKFVYNYLPAANLPMKVVIDNEAFGNGLSGKSYYDVTTDENGNYEVSVPAGINKSTLVRIISNQFEGTHSTLVKENNQIVTQEDQVIYSLDSNQGLYIQANGICIANFEMSYISHDAVAKGYTQHASLTGKIGRNSEYYIAPEKVVNEYDETVRYRDAQIIYCYTPAPNADLLLKVTYANGDVMNYNVTTDTNGLFNFSVPVQEFPTNFSYSVEIAPQQNATFKHYVAETKEYENISGITTEYIDYKAVNLNGWYAQYTQALGTNGTLNYPVSAALNNIEIKGLIFNSNDADEYNYSPYNFQGNLSWESELENDDENM